VANVAFPDARLSAKLVKVAIAANKSKNTFFILLTVSD
jgi:hypothetical protein